MSAMAFRQIFVLVILAFAVDASFRWKNCDGGSPVRISEIKLSPHPVPLRKGARVTFSGKFRVAGAAGTKYKLHLELQKKGWFWVPVPCFGYCTHDIGCDKLIDLLPGEQCPLAQKEYIVKQRSLVLPDISLPSFLKSGKYWIKGDLRDRASNRRISCVEAYVEIRS